MVRAHVGATEPAERRRIRLDPDDRRDQILAAARRLFAERPYADVSTTELAAAAGTTRTNLHHYFTKRSLFLEVLRRFGHLPDPLTPARSGSSVRDTVDELFAGWLTVLEANPQHILTLARAVGQGGDPEIASVLEQGMSAWQDRLIAVLGLTDDTTTRAHLRAFQGLVSVAVIEWLDRGILTKDAVRALLTRALLAVAEGLTTAPDSY